MKYPGSVTRIVIFTLLSWLAPVMESTSFAEGIGGVEGAVKTRWARSKRFPTLVYIEKVAGEMPAPSGAPAVMDQVDMRFVPRLIPLVAGSAVAFQNHDEVPHDIYANNMTPSVYGVYKPGESVTKVFDNEGVYTHRCLMHPLMRGYVIALQNPHFYITDENGKFIIKNVPVGIWNIKVWNEKMRAEELDRTFTVDVKDGVITKLDISFN